MTEEEAIPAPDDDAIRALLQRLARRHSSGGVTIERAAILAEGADSAAVLAWITAHDGRPEAAPVSSAKSGGGLHGHRLSDQGHRLPARYVLPPGVLN
jgi:predicted RNA polymerase sigma factor